MSATQTVPAVVSVAPNARVATVTPVAPVAPGHRPTKAHKNADFVLGKCQKWGSRRQKKHKNLDFVLEMPENGGFEGQKSTKTPILCSKCLKTWVPDPKSAQKSRFCARKARKQGFQTAKAHKNPDFVLEMPENWGSGGQKRTKMPILCSKVPDWARPK